MLQNVLRGLCRNSGGVMLVAGAIGVLAGLECLMSARTATPKRLVREIRPDRFTIRRTKSELGYCYWVLQGYGKYSGFDLFDSWQEAIDEAQRRVWDPSPFRQLVQAVRVGA